MSTTTIHEDVYDTFIPQPLNHDGRSREGKLIKHLNTLKDFTTTEGVIRTKGEYGTYTNDWLYMTITADAFVQTHASVEALLAEDTGTSVMYIIVSQKYHISSYSNETDNSCKAMQVIKYERLEDGTIMPTELSMTQPESRYDDRKSTDSWYNIRSEAVNASAQYANRLQALRDSKARDAERAQKMAEAHASFVPSYVERTMMLNLQRLMDTEPAERGWSKMDKALSLTIGACVRQCAELMLQWAHKTTYEVYTPSEFGSYDTRDTCRIITASEAYGYTVHHALKNDDFVPQAIVAQVLKSFGQEIAR